MIIFGPSGLGGVKEAVSNLNEYAKKGLKACEIAFTYGVYINKDEAIEIGNAAKNLGIILRIHSSYYVNLNSDDEKKISATKLRILKCCEIGDYLQAEAVIFHPGYYNKSKKAEKEMKEESFQKIKNGILDMLETIKKNKWNIEICAETMGKKNVFGSIEEVSRLVKETHCGFCIDFAHILARYGERRFEDIKKAFPQKKWQCHFSGIVYGDKGEKHHKKTPEEEWKKLLKFLKEECSDKDIVIINESPLPVEDSIEGLGIYNKL